MKKDAVPTIFPGLPERTKQPDRTTKTSAEARREVDILRAENMAAEFLTDDEVTNAFNLSQRLQNEIIPSGFEKLQCKLQFLIFDSEIPKVILSVNIHADLSITIFLRDTFMQFNKYKDIVPSGKIKSVSQFLNLLALCKSWIHNPPEQDCINKSISYLECELDKQNDNVCIKKLGFLIDQLKLLTKEEKQRRYSNDLLVFSYLTHAVSNKAYQSLLDSQVLSLPSIKTLNRLSQPWKADSTFISSKFITMRMSKLNEYERHCFIMIDEVYVSKKVEYVGGKLIGIASDAPKPAQTILVFMVRSICGQFEEVVCLLPIFRINGHLIKENFLPLVRFLENSGLLIDAVITDNHAANRRFFKLMTDDQSLRISVPHPCSSTRPLFLLFDTTHNIKNMYNNFMKKRSFEVPTDLLSDPQNQCQYKVLFSDIETIYHEELGKPIKVGYKITKKVLNPVGIERISAKLSHALFDESTIHALELYGFTSTLKFFKTIRKYIDIVNVKSPTAGYQKRNNVRNPVTSKHDWKLAFLTDFNTWLSNWQTTGKGLTKETFIAVHHTTSALIEIATYLIHNCGFNYILLGKFQSDHIERRFSWYRQSAGGNYLISVKNVLSTERKIRTISLLKFSELTPKQLREHAKESTEDRSQTSALTQNAETILETLPIPRFVLPDVADMKVLYKVAGYVAKTIFNRNKCNSCHDMLIKCTPVQTDENHASKTSQQLEVEEFFESIDRGGLTKPSDMCYEIIWKAWSLMTDVLELKVEDFIKASDQLNLFLTLFSLSNEDDNRMQDFCMCENSHELLRPVLSCTFTCMIKNFLSEINERPDSDARKISKLQSL